MAFPTNPTNGQQANVNGVIYIYSTTLTAWTVLTNTGANVSANNVAATNNIAAITVSATGNIVTQGFVLGNGSLLTGVSTTSANINNGTSNVTVVSSGGNITASVGGTSNVAVFATTGEYVTGVVSVSSNITGGNLLTAGIMSSTGNAIHGNILTAGLISATGNATAGNVVTAGLVSATGNVQAGNIRTAGNILIGPGTSTYPLVVSGNANAGVVSQIINANVGTSASVILQLQTQGANYVNYSVNGSAAYSAIQGVGSVVTNYYDFNQHAFRNQGGSQQVLIGNGGATVNYLQLQGSVAAAALPITATGTDANISINLAPKGSGNVTTAANVSATGNIQGNYVLGNGSQLTGISSGNSSINITVTSITANYTIASGQNGLSVGPMNTGNNVQVSIANGQRWIIL